MWVLFGVSLKAVDVWWAKWQAGGREALVMRTRGKPVGVHQVLGEAEQPAVRQAVLEHRPCDVGLGGQLWTRRLVGELIGKLYWVRLTEPGVGKYLRRWGLSFQRPDKRAVEQGPGGRPALARGGLAGDPREGEEGRRRDPLRRSGRHPFRPGHRPHLGREGQDLVVRRGGNRFSGNAMSAIRTRGRMHFMVFTGSFTAEVMCRFLNRLAGHFDRKVHLVVDGHPAHRSRKARDWFAAHPDDVETHFLPPYSPELNPDELVNADLKRSLPKQHRARNQAKLAAESRRFFRRRQRQPHIVRGYFGGPHVRYVLDENPMSF
ncbi:IS630 family transposase [Streptomyces sp. ME02-6987-2C]|uniref:IS630 family transposase n=1 Tax=unclassified Streptomyces TaxID=2593676 RepID=UPI0029AC98BF|nr:MULTISPECIES: IS630 family transposase [unclassified Streptomyces]MDX3370180.1 IS630 family transposase [Streptomyces sp. ME02-6987-2C]MDX3427075.1 IS630 family transposase [Streptomyces sp. ME02-6985-2c]